jgi:hypothetical protein
MQHRSPPFTRVAFSAAVEAGRLAYLGREYASGLQLLDASTWTRWLRRLKWLSNDEPTMLRRWYCSSLVAQVYSDAGAPLLASAKVAAAPDKLAHLRALKTRRDAIVMRRLYQVDRIDVGHAITGCISNAHLGATIDGASTLAAAGQVALSLNQFETQVDRALVVPAGKLTALLNCEQDLIDRQLL